MKPLSTTQDYNWLTKRYSELQGKYPNQYVAVKNGKVVAHGHELTKVYYNAKRKVRKNFVTEYILASEPFVLKALLQNLPYRV